MYRQCGYCGASITEHDNGYCDNKCRYKKNRHQPTAKAPVQGEVHIMASMPSSRSIRMFAAVLLEMELNRVHTHSDNRSYQERKQHWNK